MYRIVLILFIALEIPCKAQNAAAVFSSANDLYKRASYDSAAALYSKLDSAGYSSWELNFNLGNCYYKMKKAAPAILYYEKALRLAPGNDDIRFNLSMANLIIIDKIIPLQTLFYKRWWNYACEILPGKSWAQLSLSCAWIVLIFAILFILSATPLMRRIMFYTGILVILFGSVSYLLATEQTSHETDDHWAILFESSSYIKSSPDEKGVDLFILHEGVKMQILDDVGNWKRVRIGNGNEGWIKASSIEII